MFYNHQKNKKGFTLIELLVVIAIIGLLATMAMGALNNAKAKARDTRRKADLVQIRKALESHIQFASATLWIKNFNDK